MSELTPSERGELEAQIAALTAEVETLRAALAEIVSAAPPEKPMWLWTGLSDHDANTARMAMNAAWWKAAQIAAEALRKGAGDTLGETNEADKEDSGS